MADGASVLTFVGFALSGTKALYKTVSDFQRAADEAATLFSAVETLKSILTQLENCTALKDSNADTHNIKRLADACHKDVIRIDKDLKKVKPSLTASTFERTWKKIRGTLASRDLDAMWNRVNHHCMVLQFQLNLLHRNKALADQTQTLNATVTAEASQLSTRVEEAQVSLESRVQDAILSIAQKLGQRSNLTQARLEDISTLLSALQDQVAGLPAQLCAVSTTSEREAGRAPEVSDVTDGSEKSRRLVESLERLRSLASRDECIVSNEEAEAITSDLECVLDAFSASSGSEVSERAAKRKAEPDDNDFTLQRAMKRFCGLIPAAHSVEVNRGASRPLLDVHHKTVQRRSSKKISLPQGKAEIIITEKQIERLNQTFKRLAANPGASTTVEIFARVKVIIEHPDSPAVLVAHLRHIWLRNGYSFLNPVILVGKILPDDSAVFRIVANGDVEELRRLLDRREVTLRDRDSRGATLLHYALDFKEFYAYRWHPSMLKFLVDNGVDPNEASVLQEVPFHAIQLNDYEKAQNLRSGRISSEPFYLMPGLIAFYPPRRPVGMCHRIEFEVMVECLRHLIRDTGEFVDWEEALMANILRCVAGTTVSDICKQQLFGLLLANGANIDARSDQVLTALRMCAENSRFHLSREDMNYKALVHLIRSGADVRSMENSGLSISCFVYQPWHVFGGVHDNQSYRGDLWDAALHETGNDMWEFRKGYHRLPGYTSSGLLLYSRDDLEKLWIGREESCPYYHDPPVWCPYSTSPSGECPRGGTGWTCPLGKNHNMGDEVKVEDLYAGHKITSSSGVPAD